MNCLSVFDHFVGLTTSELTFHMAMKFKGQHLLVVLVTIFEYLHSTVILK